jgi:hypothetical protein
LLVCVFDIISFSLKATVDSISTNTRGTFLETSKSLGLTKITLYLFFMNLSSIKFDDCRSHFLTLLLDLKFMLFIEVLHVYFLVFFQTVFVVREAGMCGFERGSFNLDFFQVFEVIFLFLYLFGNVSICHVVLSQWYLI